MLAGSLGDAAVGLARRAADRARHVRAVRADPRLRAGHRRPGHRQPDRHDPVGGDAAAAVARARGRGRGDRGGRRRGPRRRLADRPTWPMPRDPDRRRWSSSARPRFATAVVDALEPPRDRRRRHDRGPTDRADDARSSSTTRPCATAPRARTSRSRWPTSCASRGCSTSTACRTSRAAGRARTPRTSSSSPPPGRCAGRRAKLAAFGSTRHRVEHAARRPEPARAGRRRDAGRDDLRQELAAPRDRGPGRHAGREPRHDRGLGRLRRRSRARGRLRRRALLRRLQGRPRLRARDPAGRPRRPAPGRSSCATRTAAR